MYIGLVGTASDMYTFERMIVPWKEASKYFVSKQNDHINYVLNSAE